MKLILVRVLLNVNYGFRWYKMKEKSKVCTVRFVSFERRIFIFEDEYVVLEVFVFIVGI